VRSPRLRFGCAIDGRKHLFARSAEDAHKADTGLCGRSYYLLSRSIMHEPAWAMVFWPEDIAPMVPRAGSIHQLRSIRRRRNLAFLLPLSAVWETAVFLAGALHSRLYPLRPFLVSIAAEKFKPSHLVFKLGHLGAKQASTDRRVRLFFSCGTKQRGGF